MIVGCVTDRETACPPSPSGDGQDLPHVSDMSGRFSGINAGYIAELFERYQQDPESVDQATREAFAREAPAVERPLPDRPASLWLRAGPRLADRSPALRWRRSSARSISRKRCGSMGT